MTVRANKPAFNIREKLKELTHSIGLKGRELMRAATVQEARDLVSAGRKNLVQNGDFRVNQRGGTHTTISDYHFDRWKFQKDGLAQYAHEVTQSSDAPDGFNNSLRLEVTTSETTLDASEDLALTHRFEGQDCQALMAGTSSAKPFTLSFWVKSNKTGVYSVSTTVEGSPNKIFTTTYTINQASTWEYKVIKFPPCPLGIQDTTGVGMSARWILNSGSNYTTASGGNMNEWDDYHSSLFAGGHETQIMTDGDIWQITGVQLEAGANATDFEYRTYAEELALCQRYFWIVPNARWLNGYKRHDSYVYFQLDTPVPMRASPTPTITSVGVFTNHQTTLGGAVQTTGTSVFEYRPDAGRGTLQISSTYSGTHTIIPSWEAGTIEFDAEL